MAPVLAIGALGLWVSNRPTPLDEAKPRLRFHLEKPTTLEALQGVETAFRVEPINGAGKPMMLQQGEPYLEVKTARGIEVSRYSGERTPRLSVAWMTNENNLRFGVGLKRVSAATMFFGFDGIARPPIALPGATPTPPEMLRVNGKWKVDRAQIQPINLAALPRKPLVSLREVVVTERKAANRRAGTPGQITGKAVFDLHGAAMNQKTSFAVSFSNGTGPNNATLSYGMGWGGGQTQDTLRRRVREWKLYGSPGIHTQARISGRSSADNRWPLGFQIEPFDFKTAKVGQKLKFKQFPVALPKP